MGRTRRILYGVLRTAFGVGLLAYLGLSGAIDWSALAGLAIAWPVALAALVLLFLDLGVSAWRMCVLLGASGFHITLLSSFRLTLIGNFFNACLPGATGGDVIKIYYATEGNSGRRTEVMTVMLLDRAAGMFALLALPLIIAPLFPQLLGSGVMRALLLTAALIAAAMLAGAAVLSSKRVINSRFSPFRLLPFGKYVERVIHTVHICCRKPGALLAATGISLLAHTLSIVVILLVAWAMIPAGFAWRMSIMIPLGLLANTLPLTPGGIGVGEVAFNRLFAEVGLEGGAEVLLGWRLLMLLASLTGLLFYLQGRRRFVHQMPPVPARIEEELSVS
ncbi:MAG TPA: lysylphosphatidylglycerol synthase transmembrane domain-containing protein [Blastocatellia bacterium]|nr:lysylphosphatidylglycerol synthase transmembrane domain-containing protein [Blastocatellia bacterium]